MDRTEWLKWRQQGIGGSDMPVILGDSPYRTALELYEEKIADTIVEKTSHIMERGNRYEPRIRSFYNMLYDTNFEPALFEMDFLRVSLDGLDKDSICEIKTAGKDAHEEARLGRVPKKYYAQVQHALMVSRKSECIYISYCDPSWDETQEIKKEFLAVVCVKPDLEYQEKIYNAAKVFWYDHVLKRIPPKPTEKDFKPLLGLAPQMHQWKKLDSQIKELEGKRDSLREEILSAAEKEEYPRLLCAGVRLVKQTRVGNVDYKKIPELKGVDLDSYRGKGTSFWKMELAPQTTKD